MKVRQLIRALAKHDLDMEVLMPADPDRVADFVAVSAVEEDLFAADRQESAHLRLAGLHDPSALPAVRLIAQPTAAPH